MGARAQTLGLACALAFSLAGVSLAAGPAAGRVYVQDVTLSPRTGSPHGEAGTSGAVTVCLDPARNVVSYNFTALSLPDRPTKGQIRKGTTGTASVTFGAPGLIDPTMGEVEWNDATTSTASVVSRLASAPSGYYVTVVTRAYPNGALRGRLGRWKKVASDADAASECVTG